MPGSTSRTSVPIATCILRRSVGLCVVEVEGRAGLFTSCNTLAEDGMVVSTDTDQVKQVRRLAAELLLANHPAECTSCPVYLKCELQSLMQYLEFTDASIRKRVNFTSPIDSNPLIVHDMVRCILCGRCVRACTELRGVNAITFVEEGRQLHDRNGPRGVPRGRGLQVLRRLRGGVPDRLHPRPTEGLRQVQEQEGRSGPLQGDLPGRHRHPPVRALRQGWAARLRHRGGAGEGPLPRDPRPRLRPSLRVRLPPGGSERARLPSRRSSGTRPSTTTAPGRNAVTRKLPPASGRPSSGRGRPG